MKKFILLFSTLFLANAVTAQTPKDASVELWAKVQTAAPSVTLNWITSAIATGYDVAKKLKTTTSWTTIAAGLSGTATSYVDNSVVVGGNYEYRVIKYAPTLTYNGYGYINVGIETPVVENRGKLLLVIANNLTLALAPEIKRLQDDLEGDGWEVLTSHVSTTMAVTALKTMINTTYNLDPLNTKALFFLGHVPVAYSGNFGPDAHPDHQGAWPTDSYYAEMTGSGQMRRLTKQQFLQET